jgi:isoleucyl-tRNA synthetase
VLPLKPEHELLLTEEQWAEIAIVSNVRIESDPEEPLATISPAPGDKCARCWRVLPEVGRQAKHPTLCERCTDAVESGLVCRA